MPKVQQPVFIMEIKSSHILLLSCKDLRSRNFGQKSDRPFKFFGNFQGKDILHAICGKTMDDEICLLTGMENFDYKFSFNIETNCKKSQFCFDRPFKT